MTGWTHRLAIREADPLPAPAVSIEEMRAQLRVTGIEEDAVLEGYARAATLAVERHTKRLLVARAARLRLPCLPAARRAVALPFGRVAATGLSVTIGGVAQAPEGFAVLGDSPAQLQPAEDWPVVDADGWPVVIAFTAGFTAIPDDLVVAVKMLAAEMFERRSEGGEAVSRVPVGAAMLMAPWRMMQA